MQQEGMKWQLKEEAKERLDALAFFAGAVTQCFGASERIEAVNLGALIDRTAKRIRSATGELDWHYGCGTLTINAACCEGVLGFFGNREMRLNHMTVSTDCEYLVLIAVTLDGEPLERSRSVLLQAMTEDRYKGWKDADGVILDIGAPPHTVRAINARVALRGMAVDTLTRLDANGYPVGGGEPLTADAPFELWYDGMYTLLSAGAPDNAEQYGEGARAAEPEDGWWPFEPPRDAFGISPMDLRGMNEQSAGQSGFVRREGAKLLLGDGSEVRFWAVNTGLGIVRRSNEEVEYLAARLAKMGVNLVRIHGPAWNNRSDDLVHVSEETLDRYHFFVYAMKRRGIYVKLSYYFPLWMRMKPEYGFAGFEGQYENVFPFALLQYDERFQELYKGWSRQLLLPVNPYTGIPLAQETAVAVIEIQNEDSYLFGTFSRRHIPEAQFREVGKHFCRWAADRYGSVDAAYETWGAEGRRPGDDLDSGVLWVADIDECTSDALPGCAYRRRLRDQMEFLVTFQKAFYHKMSAFFRDEIKTPILLSASNWMTADSRLMESLERYTYTATDVIDRHGYFEEGHTGEGAKSRVYPGHTFQNMSALNNPEKAIMQMNRIEGWPHMITETAWPMPNRFKGEAVPMWSVFGALQGVNAVFMFAVGDTDWERNPNHKWPLLTPSVLGQFPAFARLFRLGLVTEAPPIVRITHVLERLYDFAGSPLHERAAIDAVRKLEKNAQT